MSGSNNINLFFTYLSIEFALADKLDDSLSEKESSTEDSSEEKIEFDKDDFKIANDINTFLYQVAIINTYKYYLFDEKIQNSTYSNLITPPPNKFLI